MAKKNVAGAKKPNIFKRIAKGWREIVSELKKVTWPTFGKVLAQTGVVLVVVVFFLIVIGAFDFGLTKLLELLVGSNA
jgi:preprotein translocase subunit SecE